MTLIQHRLDGVFDGNSFAVKMKRIAEHHRSGCNHCEWIGDVFACKIRSRSMDRLIETDRSADRSRRQHADRSGQHCGFITENIAKHVLC